MRQPEERSGDFHPARQVRGGLTNASAAALFMRLLRIPALMGVVVAFAAHAVLASTTGVVRTSAPGESVIAGVATGEGGSGAIEAGAGGPKQQEQIDLPTTLYRVVLKLDNGFELHRAVRYGLGMTRPGHHQVELSGQQLLELQAQGLRFTVVGGTTQFDINPQFAAQPAMPLTNVSEVGTNAVTGSIGLSSGIVNMPIDDNSGYAQWYRLLASSAPAGAVVTDVRYRTRISDEGDGEFWCADYEIWLFSGSSAFEHRVYDNLGSGTDGGYDDDAENDADIYLNWRSTSYFDGETPNQYWGILIHDNQTIDDGRMDYVEFQVDWEVPVSGDAYEPDDDSSQANSHALNYTSAFRSILPAGDRDWIKFTLTGTSDVVVETLGSTGDTVMWLYNGALGQIAFDDDGGAGSFSRISSTALAAGTYYVKVEAFSASATIADYSISLSATTVRPDLRVPTFNVASFTIQEGSPFWVRANIENAGGASAGASHIRLFLSTDNDWDTSDDREILPKKSVVALGVGGTTQVQWDFTFPDLLASSSYGVRLVFQADSDGEVVESDETNLFKSNDASVITVTPAVDLVATSVYFRTAPNGGTVVTSPAPAQLVYPHLEFSINAQDAVAGPVWQIAIDAQSLCLSSLGLAPGSYTGWCTSPWTAVAGLHSLRGTVDPSLVTPETNESNNDTYRNYTIAGSPEIRIAPLELQFSGSSVSSTVATTSVAGERSDPPLLELGSTTLSLAARPDAVSSFENAVKGLAAGGRRHVLLQFDRPLDPSQRQELERRGIRILRYIPENAYWASVPPGSPAEVLPPGIVLHRAWVPPGEFKMSDGARGNRYGRNARFTDGTVLIHVVTFSDASREERIAAIESIPGSIIVEEVSPDVLAVRVPPVSVAKIAALDMVEWLESAPPPKASTNVTAAARISVTPLRTSPYSLNGSGINVGIWDGGSVDDHMDFGTRLTLHDAAAAVKSHATHVAGTVGGSGAGNASALGMAPGSFLHSWDWNQDSTEMRSEAQTAGIAISNHSYGTISGWHWDVDASTWTDYGTDWFGTYTAAAAEWDDVVADTGLRVFKSAGNDRSDGPDWPTGPRMDGPFQTISDYGNAKNIITICATNDDDSMTNFSSWGPARDGRVKPDLCANGSGLTSTYPDNTYNSISGTSMASPAAAGAGALLVEWFREQIGGDPAPHLLKALLIHAARDLSRPGPDYETGWGLIDAEASAQLITNRAWAEGSITATDGEATWQLVIPSGAPDLKVTLVWSDPEGSPAAARALVNDLDLELVAPNGSTSLPWVLNSANRLANATRGTNVVDNVEQVLVTNPAAGTWTVRITGSSVPMGPQAFAVVAEGLDGGSGSPGMKAFTIYNDGSSTLDVSTMALDQPGAWIQWSPAAPFSIEAGGQRRVDVTIDFAAAPQSLSTRRLLVHSNDADESPYPGGVMIHVDRTASGKSATTTTLTSSPRPSVTGQSVTLTATVASSNPAPRTGSVTFKDGAVTLATVPLASNTATFATAALTPGTHTLTAQYGGDASFNGSTSAGLTHSVSLATPLIVATAATATSVTVTWAPVPGASSYEVYRTDSLAVASALAGSTATNSFIDPSLTANKTYLYKVRARAGVDVSPFSQVDPATTILFTDPVLTSSVPVQRVHLLQLRTAVNAMRAAAALPGAVFTDSVITSGTTLIRRLHVVELRGALDAARAALLLPPIAYVDPVITAQVTSTKAVHLTQLRAGTQ